MSSESKKPKIVPYRTDLVFTHAIREAANKAKEGTALPLFFGDPE